MKYYKEENDGWTDFICMPIKRPMQGLLRLGLKVTRMDGDTFHIQTEYETRDDSVYEEGYTAITEAEFESIYKKAVRSFRRIKSDNRSQI